MLLVDKAFVKLIVSEVVTQVFGKLIGFTKSASQVLLVLVNNILKFSILFLHRLQRNIHIFLLLFILKLIRIEFITIIIFLFFFSNIQLF